MMRLRLVLGTVCAFGLLVTQLQAQNGPLLFDGPPPVSSAEINLSAYQQPSHSPFDVQELPPVPVPVKKPVVKERQPEEPKKVPAAKKDPFALPLSDMPVDAPPKLPTLTEPAAPVKRPAKQPVEEPAKKPAKQPVEKPAELPAEEPAERPAPSRKAVEAPLPLMKPIEPLAPVEQPEEPAQAPEPALERKPVPEPPVMDDDSQEDSESEFPEAPLPTPIPVAPYGDVDKEPVGSCHSSCSPTSCSRMPCISCADLALPMIPQPCVFEEFGLELGGWTEVGFSAVGTSPADRFNGPVTFNDRHAEAQMNQLWFYLEREPNKWACGPDLGGRIDVTYGTDAQFIQAGDGLESNWDQDERFYQMALPQFYLDTTLAGWTVRMGKFFTILGYESPAAPDNFFYSHAYTMQYGEPFTHMGMLVSRNLGRWLFNMGFHRGDDQFDDTDGLNALNVLGGIGYTPHGDWAKFEYAFSSSENGPGVPSYNHSLVNTIHVTKNLDYVLQGDYGEIWNENLRSTVKWWGLNQYFTYTINPCWAAAVRVEWFRDRDGTRVSGLRAGNQTPTGLAGDFYEVTLGLNWKPRKNLRIRPEVRWDFFDPSPVTTNSAFDAGNLNRQFTFGCDLVYRF